MNNRTIAIGAGVALVIAGAMYGVGRYQGTSRVTDAEQRAEAASAAAVSASAAARVSVEVERSKVVRLEGRRRLHLAIVSLDERNFGIAQEQVNAASALFASAKGGDSELTKLATELAAFKIVATDDVGEQRRAVLDWARRFDTLMPPTP